MQWQVERGIPIGIYAVVCGEKNFRTQNEDHANWLCDFLNAGLLEACEAAVEGVDECRFDHHGLCQEHHLRTDTDGNPECEVKLLLDAIGKAKGAWHESKDF